MAHAEVLKSLFMEQHRLDLQLGLVTGEAADLYADIQRKKELTRNEQTNPTPQPPLAGTPYPHHPAPVSWSTYSVPRSHRTTASWDL